MSNKLNIIFAGTSDFAAQILNSLLESNFYKTNYNICAVYTQPDRESGRGRKVTPSFVKQTVIDHKLDIPIEQPVSFKGPDKTQIIDKLWTYKPDLVLVVAYGLILPKEVLDIPKYGCINIHASILPRWRGAAPIQRAILAGDKQTGISIQEMQTGLDTGPIILESLCEITEQDTTITLTQKLLDLAVIAANKLINNYQSILNNQYKIQDNNFATYADKLNKAESIINWHTPAVEINRKIRALNPWPGVTANINNINFKILRANVIANNNKSLIPGTIINLYNKQIIIQTSENQLEITNLQFSGGNPISAIDALNGKFGELFKNNNVLE